ncbi:MAG: YHYH protein [Hyphomicrobiales bacterium]|nr:YHYH protein [Hyphomicrobiales bacterium]
MLFASDIPTFTSRHRLVGVASGTVFGMILMAVFAAQAHAHNNKVSISVSGAKRCIVSNGLPNHWTGKFPNSGNPNRISAQNIRLCVPANPKKGATPRMVRGSIGVGINGVQYRPGTAEYYDPRSPRGFSRSPSSGWKVDGLGNKALLGIDYSNAHVDERGLYHYHGVPKGLLGTTNGSLIGYAADGFEIHYIGDRARSSYQLKSGQRPSGPGGRYDGKYLQDWSYIAGSGTLDQCNGGMLNGKYVYFATNTYPFLPHCLWGDVSSDFQRRGGGGFGGPQAGPGRGDFRGQGGQPVFLAPGGQQPQFGRQQPQFGRQQPQFGQQQPAGQQFAERRGPPAEALSACEGRSNGSRCSFTEPQFGNRVSGSCRTVQNNVSACVPRGGPPPIN